MTTPESIISAPTNGSSLTMRKPTLRKKATTPTATTTLKRSRGIRTLRLIRFSSPRQNTPSNSRSNTSSSKSSMYAPPFA